MAVPSTMSGNSTSGISEVTGIGMASVAHQIAIHAVIAATTPPFADRTGSPPSSPIGSRMSGIAK